MPPPPPPIFISAAGSLVWAMPPSSPSLVALHEPLCATAPLHTRPHFASMERSWGMRLCLLNGWVPLSLTGLEGNIQPLGLFCIRDLPSISEVKVWTMTPPTGCRGQANTATSHPSDPGPPCPS